MAIQRIAALSKLGVFQKYVASDEDCDLKKLNLIYGFNGSGKTTLSRLFASLQGGEVSELLPEGGTFEFQLDDGTVITPLANLDALKGKVAVFNTDFVDDNFQWKECSAKPVFYIGKEQAEAGRLLEAAEARLGPAKITRTASTGGKNAAARMFANFKTNTARSIGEQINHRTFNAGHLEKEFQNPDSGAEVVLSDARRNELRATILQDAPLPKLAEQVADIPLAAFVKEASRCLSQTVGTSLLQELADHPSMVGWVKTGQTYHRQHDLSTCLFCGNGITPERLHAIDAAIDDAFDELGAEAHRLNQRASVIRDRIGTTLSALPSKNDIIGDQEVFDAAVLAFREAAKKAIIIIELYEEALARKAQTPNTAVECSACTEQSAEEIDQTIRSSLSRINGYIREHNVAHEQFSETQRAAQRTLLDHYLAQHRDEYRRLEREQEHTAELAGKAEEEFAAITREIAELTQRLRSHGPAAEVINKMIKAYLRHGDIEVVAQNDGYQLRRYGRHTARNLSEGEKTAITLCYFLSSLTSDGRDLKDLIVVVDDPISSLDSKALNYAFTVLKGHLASAQQLVVLTHNINFMNEWRKWLKPKVEKGAAALLFLDMRSPDGVRRTTIVKLPKLLREYDSEYHFLFSRVKAFAESDGTTEDDIFLMPNAMRRIAEIFLAFKRPGNNGLGDKIDALAKEEDTGIDGERFRAIDRLVQVESHSDSLDDLVAFSSMTLEESHQCARSLMEVFQKLDPEHYRRLCRQCS